MVLNSLEGEDVFVCTNGDADRIAFIGRRIAESQSTVIVVTFDHKDAAGRDAAVSFVRELERLDIPPTAVPRRFFALPQEDWERFIETHRHERFAIEPHVLCDAEARFGEKSFKDFADIPDTRKDLAEVAEIFARPASGGRWPVVLLTGETGSGKTFAASRIHEELKKAKCVKGKLVSLNCGEFGSSDMNAAIYGIKGKRFTDVRDDVDGAIKKAEGGVLFLDEIGTLPIELQPRLLTLLDTGKYRMHGDTADNEQANCRFIFGTNEDLKKAVNEGRFRFDLYNRITGIKVAMPSIAERIGKASGGTFIKRIVKGFSGRRGIVALTRNAEALFSVFAHQHPWKGNFRELDRFFNILQRKALTSGRGMIVSAAMMQTAIDAFKWEIGMDSATSVVGNGTEIAHQLLQGLVGIYAKDRATLEFAFKCAASAKNCRQAALKFYEGKRQKNPQATFVNWLGRFGFAFDDDAEGHIKSTAKE